MSAAPGPARSLVCSVRLVLLLGRAAGSAAAQSPASLLVTNSPAFPGAPQTYARPIFWMPDASGDVVFVPQGQSAIFYQTAAGARSRLLQGLDPMPGLAGSRTDLVDPTLLINSTGQAALWVQPRDVPCCPRAWGSHDEVRSAQGIEVGGVVGHVEGAVKLFAWQLCGGG